MMAGSEIATLNSETEVMCKGWQRHIMNVSMNMHLWTVRCGRTLLVFCLSHYILQSLYSLARGIAWALGLGGRKEYSL